MVLVGLYYYGVRVSGTIHIIKAVTVKKITPHKGVI